MKEFQTAVKEVLDEQVEDGDLLKFRVDGHDLVARPPKDGQLAMLMASIGRHTSIPTKTAGIIDFFMGIMDDESADYLANRLLDYDDDFGISEVEAIVEWMVEEWSGRPTRRPSGSTRSQRSGGPKSTPRTPAST